MGKKKWTKHLTEHYVEETAALMATLAAFRKKWREIADGHIKPTGKDADRITDQEADLADCLDNFMMGDTE